MDFIPLDDSLVKGSHGRISQNPDNYPILVSQEKALTPQTVLEASEVCQIILKHLHSSDLSE